MFKKISMILMVPIICLALVGGFLMFPSTRDANVVYASTLGQNFEVAEDLGFPGTGTTNLIDPDVSRWPTRVMPAGIANPNPSIVSGIIALQNNGEAVNNEQYRLEDRNLGRIDEPTVSQDSRVLMINNTISQPISQGWQSRQINLAPNSFYRFSIHYRAMDDANGRVYLIGANEADDEENPIFIDSQNLRAEAGNVNGWQEINFFIATHQLESRAVNLSIWLGGRTQNKASIGVMFFDAVQVLRISETAFARGAFDYSGGDAVLKPTSKDLRLQTHADAVVEIDNVLEWTHIDREKEGNIVHANWWALGSPFMDFHAPLVHTLDEAHLSQRGLLVAAGESGSTKFLSNEFKIERFGVYLISFWAKTEGNATTTVVARTTSFLVPGHEENDEEEVSIMSVISPSTDITTANWARYLILIEGNIRYDAMMQLELNFSHTAPTGGETPNRGAYVILHNLSAQKLNRTDFKRASLLTEGANLTRGALNSGSLQGDGVANGYFNIAENMGFSDNFKNVHYPLTGVTNWTQVSQAENEHLKIDEDRSGIVALSQQTIPVSSLGSTFRSNALRIENNIYGRQHFESAAIGISQGGFHEIVVTVNCMVPVGAGSSYVAIMSGSETLHIQPILIKNVWSTIRFAFKANTRSSDVSVRLMVGSRDNPTIGKAYFEFVDFSSIDAAAYNAAVIRGEAIDFDRDAFNHNGIGLPQNDTQFFQSVSWSAVNNIADCTNETMVAVVVQGPDARTLRVEAIDPVFSTTQSRFSYSVSSGSHYKITLGAFLFDIDLCEDADFSHLWDNKTPQDEIDEILEQWGVTVGLTGIDQRFENIKYTRAYTGYGFINFTWYIQATDSRTVSPFITLGSEHAKVNGRVDVNLFEVVQITESEWEGADLDNPNYSVSAIRVENTNIADTPGPGPDDDGRPRTPFNWETFFWAFSGAIMTLVSIYAIFALILRKLAKKHNWSWLAVKSKISNSKIVSKFRRKDNDLAIEANTGTTDYSRKE